MHSNCHQTNVRDNPKMSPRGPHLAANDRDASALARGQLGTTMLVPARAPGPTDHQDRRCGWSIRVAIV